MRTRLLAAFVFIAALSRSQAQQLPAGTSSPDAAAHASAARDEATAGRIHAAEAALERQDYAAAEKILSALAASRPPHAPDAQVLYDLGFAQEGTGNDSAAARSYAAALAADPKQAESNVALGLLDARQGQAEDAHRLLLAASSLESAAPALRARALRALAALDGPAHPDGAREELLAAIKLTGETPQDLRLTADLAAQSEDWSDAEAAYGRILATIPGDPAAAAGLGHVLQREGKLAEADALLTPAAAQHGDDAPLIAQLASVQATEGKTKDAIASVEQLRKLSPAATADPSTGRLLARLYATDGDYPQAEALYTKLLAASPQDPALLDALGGVQVKEGQFAAAETTLTKAVDLRSAFANPGDWGEAAGHLAFAASNNNDPRTTLRALAARATVLPNSPASLFLEATAHDSLHQVKEAERAYRAFLAVADGKFPDEEFQARHRLVALEHMR